ncbi:MAG: cobalt-precorrin-6A reductase [Pseudomonadota bacterium]
MKVLLLAGTTEARQLAGLLAANGHDVTASLAGVTHAPLDQGVETRSGGFGGAAGLTQWLKTSGTQALIDATHPCARQMPHNAAAATETLNLPRLRLMRPPWTVAASWREIQDFTRAVDALPQGARVLVTTGRGETAPMLTRPDLTVFLRSIEDPGPLPRHVHSIRARPPFTMAQERALLQKHGITHLLAKNAGGDAAKLDAAKSANVSVILIRRPDPPPGPVATHPSEALVWIDSLAPSAS